MQETSLSLVMRKPVFCICENKDTDQLRSNCAADQRLCFCYTDSTIPLLPKSVIPSLYPSSLTVQPGLCQTWSETPKTGFLTTRLSYTGTIYITLSTKRTANALIRLRAYCLRYLICAFVARAGLNQILLKCGSLDVGFLNKLLVCLQMRTFVKLTCSKVTEHLISFVSAYQLYV